LGDENKENEMCGARNTQVRDEKCVKMLVRKPER